MTWGIVMINVGLAQARPNNHYTCFLQLNEEEEEEEEDHLVVEEGSEEEEDLEGVAVLAVVVAVEEGMAAEEDNIRLLSYICALHTDALYFVVLYMCKVFVVHWIHLHVAVSSLAL